MNCAAQQTPRATLQVWCRFQARRSLRSARGLRMVQAVGHPDRVMLPEIAGRGQARSVRRGEIWLALRSSQCTKVIYLKVFVWRYYPYARAGGVRSATSVVDHSGEIARFPI